jgi:hypothetical protein
MDTPQTCGRGLAEHSALPAKFADVMSSVATVLEVHMRALDLTDESSQKEFDAYRQLVNQHRDAAVQLHTIAREMAGYRNLPMGRHDPTAMAAPAAADAFEGFVTLEQELVTLLDARLAGDREMLVQMRAAGVVG